MKLEHINRFLSKYVIYFPNEGYVTPKLVAVTVTATCSRDVTLLGAATALGVLLLMAIFSRRSSAGCGGRDLDQQYHWPVNDRRNR